MIISLFIETHFKVWYYNTNEFCSEQYLESSYLFNGFVHNTDPTSVPSVVSWNQIFLWCFSGASVWLIFSVWNTVHKCLWVWCSIFDKATFGISHLNNLLPTKSYIRKKCESFVCVCMHIYIYKAGKPASYSLRPTLGYVAWFHYLSMNNTRLKMQPSVSLCGDTGKCVY
jgi:hypothetical protein